MHSPDLNRDQLDKKDGDYQQGMKNEEICLSLCEALIGVHMTF